MKLNSSTKFHRNIKFLCFILEFSGEGSLTDFEFWIIHSTTHFKAKFVPVYWVKISVGSENQWNLTSRNQWCGNPDLTTNSQNIIRFSKVFYYNLYVIKNNPELEWSSQNFLFKTIKCENRMTECDEDFSILSHLVF